MKALRQGDVMLCTNSIPDGARRIALRPLAFGEKTGHHHSFTSTFEAVEDLVEMYEHEGKTYVRVLEGDGSVILTHQQHHHHIIPPGDFVYRPQVENSSWGTVQVRD